MKALMIIAKENYHDQEYDISKKVLEGGGVEITTASSEVGVCKGKLGGTTQATVSIAEVNVSEYDAIIFIGGAGARAYQHNVQAHLTAQEAINREKILAAICIAPTILAYAGVLEGKKATVWNEDQQQQKLLETQGAIYTGEEVTVDSRIVTANGPPAAENFGKMILELLQDEE